MAFRCLACWLSLAATTVVAAAAAASPKATSAGVTYAGINNAQQQQIWRGIPYAEPPVGSLRFHPPQPLDLASGTERDCTEFAKVCHQFNSVTDGQSEDCLYLDIVAPPNTSSKSQLPVVYWIYGGSFLSGSSPGYEAWATSLVNQSTVFDKPVITVVANYRTGPWGWLVGQEAEDAGLTNVGLQDQKAALEWIQRNIEAFGGDPKSVTLAGQSAGAVSASLHLLANNGSSDGLSYRSAFMQSGTANTLGIGGPALRQPVFDALAQALDCLNVTSPIQCLREASEDALDSATYNATKALNLAYTWAPQVDGRLVPDSPARLFEDAAFADVPVITGDTLDEGTSKHAPLMSLQSEVAQWVERVAPPVSVPLDRIYNLMAIYSHKPRDGSPYNTGNDTFEVGPLGKMAASIIGDMQFNAPRRHFLQQAQKHSRKAYNYIYAEPGPSPTSRGVNHASDLGMWVGKNKGSTLSQDMSRYLIQFINTGDPNDSGSKDTNQAANWPPYGAEAEALYLLEGNVTVQSDDIRTKEMQFVIDHPQDFYH